MRSHNEIAMHLLATENGKWLVSLFQSFLCKFADVFCFSVILFLFPLFLVKNQKRTLTTSKSEFRYYMKSIHGCVFVHKNSLYMMPLCIIESGKRASICSSLFMYGQHTKISEIQWNIYEANDDGRIAIILFVFFFAVPFSFCIKSVLVSRSFSFFFICIKHSILRASSSRIAS